VHNGEPPDIASRNRCRPGRDGVDADVVDADDGSRGRQVRDGESRCRAPERGIGEVARTAVDEVAAADLAQTELRCRWCRSRHL
jgi:hypothetical protein